MTTPDPSEKETVELPTASSRIRITKEGIESEQRVPGEHTPGLLTSAIFTICAVLAVVAPMATFRIADNGTDPTGVLAIVLIQEFVVLAVAGMAWMARKR
jgi:hypothetical protein